VFSTPEATPAFATGAAPIAAADIGVITNDMPSPPRMKAGSMCQNVECTVTVERSRQQTPTVVIPPAISQREPTRSESLPRDRGEDHDHHRPRQEGRAGLDRRPAEERLHVDREKTKIPNIASGDEDRPQVRAGEGAVLEQREVEHRQALVHLEEDEGGERDRGDGEQPEDPRDVQPYWFASIRRRRARAARFRT
jgi:hypothetical protein